MTGPRLPSAMRSQMHTRRKVRPAMLKQRAARYAAEPRLLYLRHLLARLQSSTVQYVRARWLFPARLRSARVQRSPRPVMAVFRVATGSEPARTPPRSDVVVGRLKEILQRRRAHPLTTVPLTLLVVATALGIRPSDSRRRTLFRSLDHHQDRLRAHRSRALRTVRQNFARTTHSYAALHATSWQPWWTALRIGSSVYVHPRLCNLDSSTEGEHLERHRPDGSLCTATLSRARWEGEVAHGHEGNWTRGGSADIHNARQNRCTSWTRSRTTHSRSTDILVSTPFPVVVWRCQRLTPSSEAWATEYDTTTNTYRVQDVATNTFCAGMAAVCTAHDAFSQAETVLLVQIHRRQRVSPGPYRRPLLPSKTDTVAHNRLGNGTWTILGGNKGKYGDRARLLLACGSNVDEPSTLIPCAWMQRSPMVV